jgi:acetyl/propionyl-CoA carboxylase alpha subunit
VRGRSQELKHQRHLLIPLFDKGEVRSFFSLVPYSQPLLPFFVDEQFVANRLAGRSQSTTPPRSGVIVSAAKQIGFPLMIKALAGGGGRGMRIVNSEGEFLNLFRRAFSEAQKAFGDGRVYLERFVPSPHHIEVQIIADSHGNAVHLFERECSVQRRHQKVLEIAPAPCLPPAIRDKITSDAV